MGADQYAKRDTWHRWAELEKLCDDRACSQDPARSLDAQGDRLIPMTPMAISSSDIRAASRAARTSPLCCPPPVLDYIREQGLVPLMDIRIKQRAVVEALEDIKGRDILVFDVARQTAYFDGW